jgi:epoxyqueuosine reductase
MTDQKETIRAEVKNLGFSLVGFTSSEPVSNYSVFLDWVDAGYYGEMDYLARADTIRKRADPALLMPGVRSIVVVAASYPPPDISMTDNSNFPAIAAYAQLGEDYHISLKKACHQVELILQRFYENDQLDINGEKLLVKSFVDTAPILEKSLAQKAGLGWIAKNGCFINKDFGSWLLLAEVFTNAFIDPDPPTEKEFCGKCTRCITACPAQCILPNRTLDARKCISYLTIEHQSEIPRESQPVLQNKIFGCDMCQSVCPWNKTSRSKPESLLQQSLKKTFPKTWQQALEMNDEKFSRVFTDTPVGRLHRERWLRNALVSAANSGDQSLLPLLIDILRNDPSPLIRSYAVGAVHQLAGKSSVSILQQALDHEEDKNVCISIREVLGKIL